MRANPSHLVFVAGLMAIFMTFQNPTKSYGTVSEPEDNSAEDLAGVSVIVANVIAVGYLGNSVETGRINNTIGYLGLALGGGSVVLGASESTSYSYGVMAAGTATIVLAVISLRQSSGGNADDMDDSYELSRRGPVLAPLVISGREGPAKFGFVFSSSF